MAAVNQAIAIAMVEGPAAGLAGKRRRNRYREKE